MGRWQPHLVGHHQGATTAAMDVDIHHPIPSTGGSSEGGGEGWIQRSGRRWLVAGAGGLGGGRGRLI